VSAGKVAAVLGVAPVTVRAWASKGQIPSSKTLGGHHRFDLEEVRRVLNHGTIPERYSAAATARRISNALQSQPPQGSPYYDDAPLRAVIDLRDALRKASCEGFRVLVNERPLLSGATRWDAFVAGVVQDEADRKRLRPPSWVNDRSRFVCPDWYLTPFPEFHADERADSPAAYLHHGIVAGESGLASV
jgi:excisionase family DNA binding protein